MTANPALVRGADGGLLPAPFLYENIALQRECVDIWIDSIIEGVRKFALFQALSCSLWSTRGTLFLTDLRMVFVATYPDRSTGLAAVDLPLSYIRGDKFNQPVFGCNNLSGECWPTREGGGPGGKFPPLRYYLYFKEGGVGTFMPLYFQFMEQARQVAQARRQSPAVGADINGGVATAFVDPRDPTTVFLTQPVEDEHRIQSRPVYAPEYGQDEAYEPM